VRDTGDDGELWPGVAIWLIAFASSLDRIGPLAHNVADVAKVLQIIAGRDPNDSTSTTAPVEDYAEGLAKPVKRMKIGIPKEYFGAGMDAGVRDKVEAGIALLRKLGCELMDIHLPHTDYAIATYYIIATAKRVPTWRVMTGCALARAWKAIR